MQLRTCEFWDAESNFCALHRPSAQPERKKGKWTLGKNMHGYPTVPYYREVLYCSECRSEAYWDSEDGQQKFDWCPHCGADMRERRDDAELQSNIE